MKFQVVEIKSEVSQITHEQYGDDPSYKQMLKNMAAQGIGRFVSETCAMTHEVILPKKSDPINTPITHIYRFGAVSDGAELDGRLADMATARAQGWRDAIALLSNRAKAYSLEPGAFGRVIAGAMDDVRETLEGYAR